MSPRTLRASFVSLTVVAALGAGLVAAQPTATGPQPPSPDPRLLAEVQALRAELREATRTSLAAQVVIARLQWQEQRLKFASEELAESRRASAAHRPVREQAERGLESREDAQKKLPGYMIDIDGARASLEKARNEESRLAAREAEMAARVAAEERRWRDLNARLDQLERALNP
jgi:hypothetical protein